MSKREVQLYEVLDKHGATVAWTVDIRHAHQQQREAGAGAFFRPKTVPVRPAELAEFLTAYSGGFVAASVAP